MSDKKEYGIMGFYAQPVIKQTTSRGNVNFGTKGKFTAPNVSNKEEETPGKICLGANNLDAKELFARGVKLIVEADSTEGLTGRGCTHVYTESGIKEIVEAAPVSAQLKKKEGTTSSNQDK